MSITNMLATQREQEMSGIEWFAARQEAAPLDPRADDEARVAWIRQQMPALQRSVYLNTGTSGPIPAPVTRAVIEQATLELAQGRIGLGHWTNVSTVRQQVRQRVAALVGATENEIAITQSTGDGLNLVLAALRWQPGDEIVTSNAEHQCFPLALGVPQRKYGVQVRTASAGQTDDETIAAVEALLTPRTRLLAFSHVSFSTGVALPLKRLVALAHAHHVAVLVDGAQSFAAIALDLPESGVDFYAVSGQKWLCGPEGTGALYVRKESTELLDPNRLNYFSVQSHDWQGYFVPHSNAARMEGGTANAAILSGQAAAAEWLLATVGANWAFEQTLRMSALAYHRLSETPGVEMVTPNPPAAGLVCFRVQGYSPDDIVRACTEEAIYIRTIIPHRCVRASIGYFNTAADVEKLVGVIERLTNQK